MINVLPIATTMLAALLSIEPLHLDGYAALTPAFTLMATYYWTIYRPDLLSAPLLFLIGTIQDLLSGRTAGGDRGHAVACPSDLITPAALFC
jgi:rod shape-determining protein MreD